MAERTPRVSVIIPTRDRAASAERAVRSALAQSFTDLEVIVVDDGSSDDTGARLGVVADERLQVLRREVASGRPGVARNVGIAVAKGELLAFLDDDDLWYPEKLAEQVAHLDAHPDCALVSSRCRWTGAEERVWPDEPVSDYGHDELIRANVIACSMVLVRADIVRRLEGFAVSERLRLGEDWDLWLRITQHHGFRVLPAIHGEYAVHTHGISRHRARDLWGRIAVLSRLAEREPGRAEGLERRIRKLRRELGRELLRQRRFAAALRVLLRRDELAF